MSAEPRTASSRTLDVLACVFPFVAYASSISPWPDAWDYGEYETIPYILGISHATGFPAFVLAGWIFAHVVAIGTVALRLKLLSALFVAGSAYLVRRLALGFGASEVPAFLAALVFASTNVAWTKAIHTDVHAMALFLSLAVFVNAMAYARTRNVRTIVLAATAYGLGLATHPNVMWSGLALLPGFVRLVRHDRRTAAFALAAAIVPLGLYAYLPVRSAIVEARHLDPAGASPIDGEGDVVWDTNRPSTFHGFLTEVSGSEFEVTGALGGILAVWRYPAFLWEWAVAAARELTIAALVLAAVGTVTLARMERRERIAALFVFAGALAGLPFTFSYRAEVDVTRYFFASLGVALALGASASQLLPRSKPAATAIVSLALLTILVVTFRTSDYELRTRDDRAAQPTIDEAVRDIPDGAIVLSGWIELTPLAYAAYVDRSLGTRVPISWLRRDARRYRLWSRTRRVFMLTDFVNLSELERDIPPSCRRLVADYGGQNRVYELRCVP